MLLLRFAKNACYVLNWDFLFFLPNSRKLVFTLHSTCFTALSTDIIKIRIIFQIHVIHNSYYTASEKQHNWKMMKNYFSYNKLYYANARQKCIRRMSSSRTRRWRRRITTWWTSSFIHSLCEKCHDGSQGASMPAKRRLGKMASKIHT